MPKKPNREKLAKKLARAGISSPDLSEFSRHNPWCRVENDRGRIEIALPWNDASLALVADKTEDVRDLTKLNNLVLPERFNAVYHRDTKQMEYIFGELFEHDEPLPAQKFMFRWRSSDFTCYYGPVSEEVLFLARIFIPLRGPSDLRHLEELQDLQLVDKLPEELRTYYEGKHGVSFYVGPLASYDEELLISFAKHLNFYMSYFDRKSPQIDIVPQPPAPVSNPPTGSAIEIVPPVINGVELDPFLLDLNLAAKFGDTRLRMMYYYQILEYAAFYWVEDSVKASICKILQAPDLQAKLDDYFPKLIDALVPTRQNDEHKIKRVIEFRVNPNDIWSEISSNISYFSSAHTFEGGFRLEALVSADTTAEAFSKMWTPRLFETLRAIRNSLVHARESRTDAVISPTNSNSRLLRPWIPVVRRMAEQVTVYDR